MAEVKNSRVYRTVYKSNWRDMIPRILVSGKHVNFVKIDTTGLGIVTFDSSPLYLNNAVFVSSS